MMPPSEPTAPKLPKRWPNLTSEQCDDVIAVLMIARDKLEQPRTGAAYAAGEPYTAAIAWLLGAPVPERLGPETVDVGERARALALIAVGTSDGVDARAAPELGHFSRAEIRRLAEQLRTYTATALHAALPGLNAGPDAPAALADTVDM